MLSEQGKEVVLNINFLGVMLWHMEYLGQGYYLSISCCLHHYITDINKNLENKKDPIKK